jgi:hypothetical protein
VTRSTAFFAAVLVVLSSLACRPGPGPDAAQLGGGSAATGKALLGRVQAKVDAADGYLMTVTTSGLAIPEFGTIDGGEFVSGKGFSMEANVRRNGETDYTLRWVAGELYFFRKACGPWQRLGGGKESLAIFQWARSGGFQNAAVLGTERLDGKTVIRSRVPGLGNAVIEVDTETELPARVVREENASGPRIEMVFTKFGGTEAFTAPDPAPPGQPGGPPC